MPNRKKKHNTAVGVFETKARADQAVVALKAAGFTDADIGMVHRDAEGHTVKTGAADETHAGEGAAIGAAAGAGVAGLVSLGVSFGVIPVIGPILAVGPLAAALISAAGGAAAAGIGGALIGWGIPEEDATYYENEVKAGRYLVTVETGDRADEARAILHRYSGFDRSTWAAVRADRTNTLEAGSFQTEDGRVIQLKKEHLKAEKETVSTGDVKVRKEVRTEHQQLTVPVEHEEVVIERRPANGRKAGTAAMGAEEIRIPTKEERVHVSKETVVKEEVSVGKRKVRDTETVTGDVQEEELVVESDGDAKVRQTNKPGKK
jgi:uncharacterized protein (TIGR02271 family)